MNICIIGRSCSGKTAVAKELQKMGYERTEEGCEFAEWRKYEK